ncbi:hypothetical protein ACJMK2_007624 [Sinanodonta woodiana]|uniref:Uncharacterized protein n=1 Tax=Sinanodonta woodiana TaxID=1069815 RepID=A0ABD3VM18_SINWO
MVSLCKMFIPLTAILLWSETTLGKKVFKLEAESYWTSFIYRQAASQVKTIPMHENDVMSISFCIRRTTLVTVKNILYTNDGPENVFSLSIDGMPVGYATSHNKSNRGELWNVISRTGQVGTPLLISGGPHRLQLYILPPDRTTRTDPYGIEVDAVQLEVDDDDMTNHYIHCWKTLCNDDITYRERHRDRNDVPSAKIVQMSIKTECAEEDNIKIPVYHEKLRQFRITAMPPRYRTFWQYKTADFDGCPEYSDFHWQYLTVACLPDAASRKHRTSFLSFHKSVSRSLNCIIKIEFDLEGMHFGKTNAHIGSHLMIRLAKGQTEIIAVPHYGILQNDSIHVVDLNPAILNNVTDAYIWEVPDFTWAQKEPGKEKLNQIFIEVPTGTIFSELYLRRRPERDQIVTDIYDNNQVKIQKVEFDFWWRDPVIESGIEQNMTVYVDTLEGEMFQGFAHYIRFIEKRVWSPNGDMDQTFVLYQDGSARILPIVPHGLSTYVAFGNDIVIGQADPYHFRPHAPIRKLVIHPHAHLIYVYYQDGGSAIIHLFSSVEQTNVTVTNVSFVDNFKPFAIFRSTWVEDGRSKVDHVTVNGLPADHILLDKWKELYGTTFIFFRRCISIYNTQSPDYALDILSDVEV